MIRPKDITKDIMNRLGCNPSVINITEDILKVENEPANKIKEQVSDKITGKFEEIENKLEQQIKQQFEDFIRDFLK